MSRHNKLIMDGKDMVRFLTATIGSFIEDRLLNEEQRILHKEQCAERLAAEDGSCEKNREVHYSDQAVLANLDWGIDALEEAINTSNMETKLARLDHAEKMLQVCAMLDSNQKTAGVPNFYLCAWAHLNLAFLWKLRNNVHSSILHVLEMFNVDPFFSRVDFAPELWEALFLPHMSSIVGWYSEARHKIMMEVIPDSADLSFTADFDHFFNDSLIFSMRPDQAEKLRETEKLYGESLDENTRLYAKYFKACINFDPASNKKGMPMLPIAEPPMTPLHEVSRSIPDYVKFGPILPKSAGFSPILKGKKDEEEHGRSNIASDITQKLEEFILSENADHSDYGDVDVDSEVINKKMSKMKIMTLRRDEGSGSKTQHLRRNSISLSPWIFSPVDSSCTSSPEVPSPKQQAQIKKEPERLLRLLSGRNSDLNLPISLPNSLPESPHKFNESSICSAESDGEVVEMHRNRRKNISCTRSMSIRKTNTTRELEDVYPSEIEEEISRSTISLTSSEKIAQRRPPKDFSCPITGLIFNDPVTLETGQTYERKAIQEWLRTGNTTCPITRQPLSATILPQTNYVLKRLITSWREQHPDLAQEFSYAETPRSPLRRSTSRELVSESKPSAAFNLPIPQSTNDATAKGGENRKRFTASASPTSVISQAAGEAVINSLKPYTQRLCTSEDIQECEEAVLKVARIWKDCKADTVIHAHLAKPMIVNGFVEILLASADRGVLRTSIYILSKLISADESISETLTSVDSDFDGLATLLKNGLAEATVLIYLLRPAFSQLSSHHLVPSLVQVIMGKTDDDSDEFRFIVEPKDAAIALLDQILQGGDKNSKSTNALSVISENGLPALIKCLGRTEGRVPVVSILLSCMRADKACRNLIAGRVELSPVLEIFHAGDDSSKSICIEFLAELVRLNRRTFCNQILQIIKDEGAFSTMHTFLVYLQMAPMEQQPVVASILLQLDLLVEPSKMSIYREEAVEALIEALHRKDFPVTQATALDALASLFGRLAPSGRSLTEAWLLKTAGLNQPYNALMRAEKMQQVEDESTETLEAEEKIVNQWEKRVAFVLCNHENGSIFKALEECLKSNSLEMAKQCLVIATWLTNMLTDLPSTGVRDIARRYLLVQLIHVLQSSKNLEEKVLATLALRSFIQDLDALKEIGMYARSICKPLRKLKRCSTVAVDVLKALMNLPSVKATELWSCTEALEIDTTAHGEVLSLVHLRGRVFSSHSDGHIKVWDSGKKILRLIQDVREHGKAVTCLFISPLGKKLYSGSLDKTIRVWAIGQEEIRCVEVYDIKEPIQSLVASTSLACFASHMAGVKVYNWGGVTRHVNFNKNVKCLAMMEENIYCGCTAYSIQEVDLQKHTSSIFFSGTRKILGKQTIQALYVHDGHLFAGGTSVGGIAGKVFSLSTKVIVGSLSTGFDIHSISANKDFVFTGTKCGTIEVWLRERLTRVASLKVHGGGSTKITSLACDADGEMLLAGTSDGKIQAWSLD